MFSDCACCDRWRGSRFGRYRLDSRHRRGNAGPRPCESRVLSRCLHGDAKDPNQGGLDAKHKSLTETNALSIRTKSGHPRCPLRVRRDQEREAQGWSRKRALTSSQLDPAFGFASYSATRRRRSKRCSSVSGAAMFSSGMLSQISSTSRNRCAELRRSIPRDCNVGVMGSARIGSAG